MASPNLLLFVFQWYWLGIHVESSGLLLDDFNNFRPTFFAGQLFDFPFLFFA